MQISPRFNADNNTKPLRPELTGYHAYFQPIGLVNEHGILVAHKFEALCRRTDGVPPGIFLPELERSGKIRYLDLLMFEESCIFLNHLNTPRHCKISVNAHAHTLFSDGILEETRSILDYYNISQNQIEFEVLEGAFPRKMKNRILDALQKLSERGHPIAIDDFGTDRSNMLRVREVAEVADITTIKIDPILLFRNEGAKRWYLDYLLAQNLSHGLVVEGVEHQRHYEGAMNIFKTPPYFQGYYFSRPLPQREAIAYARRHETPGPLTQELEI